VGFLRVPQRSYIEDDLKLFIADDLMLTKVPGDIDKTTGQHGSLTTIFSVWNAMVGTGLVTIPWAYSQSGIFLGLFLTFITFIVSFTTQYMVMIAAGKDMDYTDTLKKQFGKSGWYASMILFIVMLSVPLILYSQLLA